MNPEVSTVICAGLSCVDMMLMNADRPRNVEAITAFNGTRQVAGGSCCNTARVVAKLGIHAAAATLLGDDPHGKELKRQLEEDGVDTESVVVDGMVNTSLAVLPVFKEGGRGCFVDLGANTVATPHKVFGQNFELLERYKDSAILHFGYPHLMQGFQGESFGLMARTAVSHGLLLSVDINGADRPELAVFGDGMQECFFLHANLEEAAEVAGLSGITEDSVTADQVVDIGKYFLDAGLGLVSISLGANGAYLASNADPERLSHATKGLVTLAGVQLFRPAYRLLGQVNSTGAGDAFTAGALAYAAQQLGAGNTIDPAVLLARALVTAAVHIDSARSIPPYAALDELIEKSETLTSRFE